MALLLIIYTLQIVNNFTNTFAREATNIMPALSLPPTDFYSPPSYVSICYQKATLYDVDKIIKAINANKAPIVTKLDINWSDFVTPGYIT